MRPEKVRSASIKPNAARIDCYNQSSNPDLNRDAGDSSKETKSVIMPKGDED